MNKDYQKKNSREKGSENHPRNRMSKIDRILIDAQKQLRDSLNPVSIDSLNSYERKRIHSFFDDKEDFETKTYRRNSTFVLKVFPVGNLKREAKAKADHVLETGEIYTFPRLSGYERYVIHNYLQDFQGIETESVGEEDDRRLQIKPVRFGRSLKKIMKKIRLM